MRTSYLQIQEEEGFPNSLDEFQDKIGVRVDDISKLRAALTHPSFWGEFAISESERLERSYERLEFLGDSVIALTVCTFLFREFPDDHQGILSKAKAHLVSKSTLLKASKRINLNDYIRVGKGVEESAGRDHKSFMVDCFESVIGAVYLDKGFELAAELVLRLMTEELKAVKESGVRDYKTTLQEFVQKEFRSLPKYRLVSQDGPDHNKKFTVEVCINGEYYGTGTGFSKKEAEISAAREALRKLNV
ncbi:MAG TPA: ribonuclease III [bacterium]|nr:ribonuclease III [bacterium]